MNPGHNSPERRALILWSQSILENAKQNMPHQIARPTERDLDNTPCRKGDPNRFFPEKDAVAANLAKAECFGCRVRAHCLEVALSLGETGQSSGIWGGTSYSVRKRILAARAS